MLHSSRRHFFRHGSCWLKPTQYCGKSPCRIGVVGSRKKRPDGRPLTGSLLERHKQRRQDGVKGGRKRVGHGNSPPRKPLLEIFRQEQTALGLRRRG